jgi:beta-mannosidase
MVYSRYFLNTFSISIFFSCTLLFWGSNSTRISLTGNDWLVSNGQSLQVTGTVPGSIHTALLSAKMIDEPYWGFGDTLLRYLIYESWTFTKNFSLPTEFLNLTQFTLHFDQIDTVSNITLNECFLGNTSSMFFAYAFNISNTCLHKDNILRVKFLSPAIYALNQAIVYNVTIESNCTKPLEHSECYIQFIRKEPCSFGWDWVSHHKKFQNTYLMFFLCRGQPLHPLVLQVMYISKESTVHFHHYNLIVLMLFHNHRQPKNGK